MGNSSCQRISNTCECGESPLRPAIAAIHAELLESLRLAVSIFLNGDLRAATRLIERKASLRDMESHATALHVRLLRDAVLGARAAEGDTYGVGVDAAASGALEQHD